jgi:hypothetical protein
MSIQLTPQQQQALDTQEDRTVRHVSSIPAPTPAISLFERWTMNPSGNFLKTNAVSN